MDMKIVNLNPEVENMTLYEEGDLRIHMIARLEELHRLESGELCVRNLSLSAGVGIEYTSDGQTYIVICFVKPTTDGKIKVEPIGSRVRDYKKQNLENIKKYEKFKKIAKQFVKEALKENEI